MLLPAGCAMLRRVRCRFVSRVAVPATPPGVHQSPRRGGPPGHPGAPGALWRRAPRWVPPRGLAGGAGMADPQWCFADFRLDPTNARLWQGAQVLALTPKAFDVLHYLVTHADRLVTKDALLDAVWPETAVSDGVVRMAIGEVRRALGDTAQAPRYIATVQRRGYRFVASVTCVTPEAAPP